MLRAYHAAYDSREDLKPYGSNALMLFALQLRFQIEDIHATADTSLTDGPDDKRCDLVYIDPEAGDVVIAQSWHSADENKACAKANKAADLNVAVSWLLTADLASVPERLRVAAAELRQTLSEGKVRSLQFWYIHNVQESTNVQVELDQVARGACAIVRAQFPSVDEPECIGVEVGVSRLNDWYKSLTVPILVSDEMSFGCQGAVPVNGDGWNAVITSVPAQWLYEVFQKHGTNLFSANVRHYLGSRKASSNINYGIKKTAGEEPSRFWVYNNGITALCESAQIESKERETSVRLRGLSIVNGAQTTGAIGQLPSPPPLDMWVPARFVVCRDQNIVQNIIRYNNSQNPVKPTDFRSTDRIQRRLVQEFERIPGCSYNGGRRGGSGDAIKRPGNAVPAETIAQALAAIVGDPGVAYHQKSEIWESDKLYSRYFGDAVTARHVLFAYSLYERIREKRGALREKGVELRDSEKRSLAFLDTRGAAFLLMSAVGASLATILGRAVPSIQALSFADGTSLSSARDHWTEVLDSLLPLCSDLNPVLKEGLRKDASVTRGVNAFVERVESLQIPLEQVFRRFASNVHEGARPVTESA